MMTKTRGFTLIELLLSMSFLSMLLVFIGLLSMQITNIYNKGTTFRAVNQSGIELTNDLTSTLNQSSKSMVEGPIDMSGKGGRLCTGSNSYAWNYGKILSAGDATQSGANQFNSENSENETHDVRFVKVPDPGNSLCQPDGRGAYPAIDRAKANELLPDDNKDIAVSTFAIVPHTAKGNQTIYAMTLTLGTNSQQALNDDSTCKPPEDAAGYENYCAVNSFEFTARAGNGTPSEGNN